MIMASAVLRRGGPFSMFSGAVSRILLIAVALVASPRRLGVTAAGAEMRTSRPDPNWHVVSVASMLPAAVCTPSTAASNSTVLNVVHRHGPCLPLQSRGGTPPHAQLLDHDQARVDSIHRKIAAASTVLDQANHAAKGVSLPAQRGISLGTGNYVVSVGLGTPARDMTVVFDTGSDLSWVQCTPCSDCYEQKDPLFDPARSKTYSAVPCAAPECQGLDSHSCSRDKKCRYEVVYGDQSQTDGDLARDTLTLGTPSNTLPGFVFGCGDKDTGLFGKTDGLVGLGREKVSLSSQAAAKFGAGFSYCLPSSPSGVGYLSLGLGRSAPGNARFTAMATRRDTPSFYYVNLVAVKVGGRTVRISPVVFASAGTVIDSGTVITRLPPRAYAALRRAFTRSMGRYRYKKAPALSILDTCYDFTGHTTVQIPSLALVFAGGTTVELDFSGVLYVAKASQACLAFAPNGDGTDVGILGNTQQKTLAVVYDVANQKIGFGANGCS
ncbi:aspartyl protease family protein At5g10770-like [Lolium perenne]|uniref:aspartyl protease family protein At5g10770-like n=1 Tax=Lolium perenne TaxID=4522 RepID=UPI0021F5A808|nr:aspartyl protease family protein At5g10770-like [Lolium perenne]